MKKKFDWGYLLSLACALGLALLVLYLIGLASQTLTGGYALPDFSDLHALWARTCQRWETGWGINLTPGYTIRSMLERGSYGQKVINLAGNVVAFMPFGFFLPVFAGRGFVRAAVGR